MWFVVGISYTSGNSMYPTVKDKTVLVINKLEKPTRGDIVTIYSNDLRRYLCKRVIGLEGDTVEIKSGVVYLNGKKLEESFNADKTTNGVFKVDANEVFVMGDNRNNSTDSRELGCLRLDDIKGVCIWNTGIKKEVFIVSILLILVCYIICIKLEAIRHDKRVLSSTK